MLSRDCNGCGQLKLCRKRYDKVAEGGKVYCLDGTAHLIDSSSLIQIAPLQVDSSFFVSTKFAYATIREVK